jgi:hypothetical protein
MLNQSNYNFNKVLTYLDQGGNNIWWSSNSTIKTISSAELIITGQGIDSECIEEDCIPICSEIVESEEAVIEQLTRPQYLIYPTFIIESNTNCCGEVLDTSAALIIRLNCSIGILTFVFFQGLYLTLNLIIPYCGFLHLKILILTYAPTSNP